MRRAHKKTVVLRSRGIDCKTGQLINEKLLGSLELSTLNLDKLWTRIVRA